jgi:hypothetical protein
LKTKEEPDYIILAGEVTEGPTLNPQDDINCYILLGLFPQSTGFLLKPPNMVINVEMIKKKGSILSLKNSISFIRFSLYSEGLHPSSLPFSPESLQKSCLNRRRNGLWFNTL